MHKIIWTLAWPIMLSNISVPLLGLIDAAILGHLDASVYLAAVALGANILTFLFWSFGFLRMSTTGLVAQAVGRNDSHQATKLLYQGLFLALSIGLLLIVLQPILIAASIYVMGASEQVSQIASDYLAIRLWSAPATLGLYVFIGWFIGQQNTRLPLVILVTATSLNAILDYIMVYHFGLHAKGIAWATLIAEYTALLLAIICWLRYYPRQSIAMTQFFIGLKSLVRTNQFLFFRTLTLLLVFAFFTSQGARMGDEILAVNALLLTLLMLISNALDGFAHAAESLCGKYYAQNNKNKLNQAMLNTAQWSVLAAFTFSIILYYQGEFIITLLTNQASLIETFTRYIPLLVFLPLVAVAGYWLDGVFIGLTLVKPMQNTMIIAALFVFLPMWFLLNQYGNTGLWLAFYGFMLSRGILMGGVLLKINKK